jgi:dephospho-CoA kinase
MLLIGLTGSIATGKSTVSSLLSSPPYSLPIIDADKLARKVVEPGTAGYNKILSHFLSTTPDLLLPASECGGENGPNGKGRPLNRPALGRRIFGDTEDRKKDRGVLNSIVHPAVRKETYKALLYCYLRGCWAVVLDVPLLFESRFDRMCGTILVVAVSDPAIQMKRLRERDPHLSAEDAENRVRSQGDVKIRARRAEARGSGRGYTVWNDGGKQELEKEVSRVMEEVKSRSPSWWAWLLLLCPPAGLGIGAWNMLWSWVAARRWEEETRREKAKL